MSTQVNAVPEATPGSQAAMAAAANISEGRRFFWLVRREFWEHRSLYIAPLAAAAFALLGFLIGLIHLPGKMSAARALDAMQQHELIRQPHEFTELLLMATLLIVAAIYCLDALYGERRDRSILFWKSLPISDVTTVLAKAVNPLVILPLLTFAVIVATQLIMAVVSTVVLLGSGESATLLWNHLPLFRMWLMLFDHVVGFHGLFYAPFYCWLLLVSAWAPRAPFLWATLPPVAIGFVEKIAFNTSYFAALLQYRFTGGPESAAFMANSMTMNPLPHFNPVQFLGSPGLWMGFAVSAAFLAAAVRLRRYREPM